MDTAGLWMTPPGAGITVPKTRRSVGTYLRRWCPERSDTRGCDAKGCYIFAFHGPSFGQMGVISKLVAQCTVLWSCKEHTNVMVPSY